MPDECAMMVCIGQKQKAERKRASAHRVELINRLSGSCRDELMFTAIYGSFEPINRHMWRHKRLATPAITAIPNEPINLDQRIEGDEPRTVKNLKPETCVDWLTQLEERASIEGAKSTLNVCGR